MAREILKKVVVINKKEGETPLEGILRFKRGHPKYRNLPMTYAGRLDPMAEGVLLLLVGEECKKKGKYQELPKTYEIEVLFGAKTDTYDVLGETKGQKSDIKNEIQKLELQKILKTFVGKFRQEYPAFSSKAVGGQQLFILARSGKLPKKMPSRIVEIFSIKTGAIKKISAKKLLADIIKRISKVKGDFRQKNIVKKWKNFLAKKNGREKKVFSLLSLKVSCGSGTYMRSLAHKLGDKIKIPALAYRIKRTRVGKYKI